MTGSPVIARLRARLSIQVDAPLQVSASFVQHFFDEDSAAYSEIEIREGEAFAIVVVLGALPSEEFVVRVWHRYADEVWLVDIAEEVVTVIPRDGFIRVFEIGETLRSPRLPAVAIPVGQLFELAS